MLITQCQEKKRSYLNGFLRTWLRSRRGENNLRQHCFAQSLLSWTCGSGTERDKQVLSASFPLKRSQAPKLEVNLLLFFFLFTFQQIQVALFLLAPTIIPTAQLLCFPHLVVTTTNMTKTWFIHPFNLFRHESARVCVSRPSPCEEGSRRSRGEPSASVKATRHRSAAALANASPRKPLSDANKEWSVAAWVFAVLLQTLIV